MERSGNKSLRTLDRLSKPRSLRSHLANKGASQVVLARLFSQKRACSSLVRHATARVIAAIAEVEIPLGQWPALLPALTQAATSTVVSQRETGAFTLCTILEKTGLEMQDQLPDFFKLFSSLAHDNDSLEVRTTSVRCVRSRGCVLRSVIL